MSLGNLNGKACIAARAQIPAWGLWFADAVLDVEATMAGPATLRLGDLTLKGTIVSGGPYKGRSTYRIVSGAGGWGRELPAKSYNKDAGLAAAKVVQDAANEAGETVDVTGLAGVQTAYAFAREAAPASRVLQQLAERRWYVDETGVTRIGRRASVDFAAPAVRLPVDEARGVAMLATEAIATLLPGAVVDGREAVDVWHTLSPNTGLRSLVWGALGDTLPSGAAALAEIFEQLDPFRKYRGTTEYRVVSQSGERLNLQAVRASRGMPDLQRVRVRPGVPGCRADVALGSSVLVRFIDDDPGRPYVSGFEDPEGAGFAPSRLDLVPDEDDTIFLGVGADRRVVRYGDTIMMPVGAGGTPTPTEVVADPTGPSVVSRVRA